MPNPTCDMDVAVDQFPSVIDPLPSMLEWKARDDESARAQALLELERGSVVSMPDLPFPLEREEHAFLRADCVAPGSKSIKFSPSEQKLWGISANFKDSPVLKRMLTRFSTFARGLLATLSPRYDSSLTMGMTSFRPISAEDITLSKRHDDRLLHVDAFPSRPMHGKRILRVFANLHPAGRPRQWRVGEPFECVARRFLPHIRTPWPGLSSLLHRLRITKQKRSLYDHFMLRIHDCMKFDNEYQATVPSTNVSLPAGPSWIVYTDSVSHAAVAGQHVVEQTFLLPLDAMADPELSPLRILEKLKDRPLI
jgi:hypothetical protein